MPSDYARRGRPRGSGLDDRGQLRRIVELLDADPNLKPTTAIKAIGVSDPSTIRRLRDKLKSSDSQGTPSCAIDRGGGAMPSAVLVEAQSSSARFSSDRASSDRAAQSSVRRADLSAAGLVEVASGEASEAKLSWFAQWCALGLSAMSTTVEAQMAIIDDLLRVPQVESALRHQLKCNEVAKAFCPKRSSIRDTLH
jgi:hypothetical protein